MLTKKKKSILPSLGFTLVELLVVIAIMSALTALMLPRLRLVNKDRGIREAARVVGSKFAEASERARRDGKASVTLVRNPNMVDVDEVGYASTTVYLSRAVPNYTGDSAGTGSLMTSTVLRIPEPLEYDPSTPEENVVRQGDLVRMNTTSPVTSTVGYSIETISPASLPNFLDLTLSKTNTQPDIPYEGGGTPTTVYYVIERQPKILRSSITDLPPGYMIDLRLSGPLVSMEPSEELAGNIKGTNSGLFVRRPAFYEKLKTSATGTLADQYSRVDIFFDSTGGVASVRIYYGNWDTPDATSTPGLIQNEAISEPLQLFISPLPVEGEERALYSDTNLWVTISNTSGGVNIGYNTPPLTTVDGGDAGATVDLHELVADARKGAQTGRSTSQ